MTQAVIPYFSTQPEVSKERPVICWWSGGVTSAVACWLAIRLFGKENVKIIFMDTRNEDESTYCFFRACEKWYGVNIGVLSNPKYESIQEVWYKYLSLNVANGAICSSELKRDLRRKYENNNMFSYQVFGFDIDEVRRVKGMVANNGKTNPIFPLLLFGYSKKDCIDILIQNGIDPPRTYELGFNNNNCFKTGCIQGGIGYWQKMQREFPEKFLAMAKVEHELTNKKGVPVTMLRHKKLPLFLVPHPGYPLLPNINDVKGREPKPLMECNGFCGTNDLMKNETEEEINFAKV